MLAQVLERHNHRQHVVPVTDQPRRNVARQQAVAASQKPSLPRCVHTYAASPRRPPSSLRCLLPAPAQTSPGVASKVARSLAAKLVPQLTRTLTHALTPSLAAVLDVMAQPQTAQPAGPDGAAPPPTALPDLVPDRWSAFNLWGSADPGTRERIAQACGTCYGIAADVAGKVSQGPTAPAVLLDALARGQPPPLSPAWILERERQLQGGSGAAAAPQRADSEACTVCRAHHGPFASLLRNYYAHAFAEYYGSYYATAWSAAQNASAMARAANESALAAEAAVAAVKEERAVVDESTRSRVGLVP